MEIGTFHWISLVFSSISLAGGLFCASQATLLLVSCLMLLTLFHFDESDEAINEVYHMIFIKNR